MASPTIMYVVESENGFIRLQEGRTQHQAVTLSSPQLTARVPTALELARLMTEGHKPYWLPTMPEDPAPTREFQAEAEHANYGAPNPLMPTGQVTESVYRTQAIPVGLL